MLSLCLQPCKLRTAFQYILNSMNTGNFYISFWYLCMKYYGSYPNLSFQFFLTETYAQLTIDPAVKYQ
jgi:hypothetical protein